MKPKKLFFVTRRLSGGGAERMTVSLANALVKRGFDVHVIAVDGDERTYELAKGVKYHCLGVSGSGIIQTTLRLVKLKWYFAQHHGGCVIALGGAMNYLDAIKIDRNFKLIVSERNYPLRRYTTSKSFRKIESFYERADRVVFQTPEARDCFSDVVKSKSCIIPNMVNPPTEQRAQVLAKRFVTFGRLAEQKNFPLLIDAFALFRTLFDPGNEWRLDVYGQGSQKECLTNRIIDMGLEQVVHIHPFSPCIHRDISDACCFVSSSDYEGLQNALLESMAMGMPCIATDCLGGGARFITDSGRRALLVPPGDVQALAEAMGVIAVNKEITRALSTAAKEVVDQFSEESVVSQWVELLNSHAMAEGDSEGVCKSHPVC